VEGPIRIREPGDKAPEIFAAQSVQNQNRLSSKADLEILSSFPKKEMNIKVEDNFVTHNLDTESALFGVRTWEIWHQQGRAANQENLDKADFGNQVPFPPKEDLVEGKVEHAPRLPKGINITP
jgi:hypothetical protein